MGHNSILSYDTDTSKLICNIVDNMSMVDDTTCNSNKKKYIGKPFSCG